ncbi:MAG TPA: pyruvate formate lyase family protein [Clostridia bacterium]
MANITLKSIRLPEYTLENLGRISELRRRQFETPVEICIERAKYITKYLKDMADPNDSPIIKRAKAVNYFLSNKEPVFLDGSLLAGTTTSKSKGAPLYPEFIALTIWPELDTISNRPKNPQILTKEDAETLNFDIFPYWLDRDVLSVTKKEIGNKTCVWLLEKLIFFVAGKAGCISHTVPDFKTVLSKGMNSMIDEAKTLQAEAEKNAQNDLDFKDRAEFYRAVQIALEGILNYASNLSAKALKLSQIEKDPKRKQELIKMAQICKSVPALPAKTFHEAVNAVWICLIAIHAENINMAVSPGRLDQVLYEYYRNDIDSGLLTVKEALEIVGCLWLKLGDNVDMVPQVSEELFGGAGTAPAVTLGGVGSDGEDAVNDLTYIMLKVTELLKTRDPNLNARYHYEKNTKDYRDRVCEVIAATKAVPAFHNDVENIKTLQNQGTAIEHARDYAIIGCVELSSAGRSYDASSSIIMNLSAPLEMALYNGKRFITGDDQIGPITGDPETFKSYDEFLNAFKIQAKWLIEQAIDMNEYLAKAHQKMLPTPILSALFEGPVQKGKDLIFGGAVYNASGATHVGFADTVDSLNAIEAAVFKEKYCTFKELLDAVKDDFKDREDLRQYLVNRTPKYGTDDRTANENAKKLVSFLYNIYQSHINYRGGKYRPAYWSMTNHSGQGKITYALPNGRKAHQPFASGITPVSGATRNITECLNSVGALGSINIPGGEALNIKFVSIENADDIKRFGQIVEAYFKNGGQQVQANIMSYEMLKEAKADPGKYPELLVRVSGYSAYFNDLNDTMKDELISRTEYDIRNGNAVPFSGL